MNPASGRSSSTRPRSSYECVPLAAHAHTVAAFGSDAAPGRAPLRWSARPTRRQSRRHRDGYLASASRPVWRSMPGARRWPASPLSSLRSTRRADLAVIGPRRQRARCRARVRGRRNSSGVAWAEAGNRRRRCGGAISPPSAASAASSVRPKLRRRAPGQRGHRVVHDDAARQDGSHPVSCRW
jgi:hypothetical protein